MQRWFFVGMIMLVLGGLNGVPAASATDTDLNIRATQVWCGKLPAGATMHRGDYVGVINSSSTCGQAGRLIFQHDGNVVSYSIDSQGRYSAQWATNTVGTSANRFVMQGDGNLVLYDTANRALWNSRTHGYPGAYLQYYATKNIPIVDSQGFVITYIR